MTPKVSIVCNTYNHEKYIAQALDSFLAQKTDFPFEVLVHDDASTDGTAAIVRQYADKYPDIIKPILQKENQFSQGVHVTYEIQVPRVQGKYIAFCEGDDYWTDSAKLQRQVDFLETHSDFSICFHEAKIFDQSQGDYVADVVRKVTSETDICELAKGNYIHTMTVVYRNNPLVREDLKKLGPVVTGDYALHMLNAKHGKIKKMPECMAVYRLNQESVWGTKDITYQIPLWNEMLIRLIPFFEKNVQKILHDQYMNNCKNLIRIGEERVKESMAYRVGKLLLKPLSLVRSKRK